MSAEAGNTVKSRGPWTYVKKLRSGKQPLYVSVTCDAEPPRDAVELAGGVCGKNRCAKKPVCYRQIRFSDGHRGYEFSCSQHLEMTDRKKTKAR